MLVIGRRDVIVLFALAVAWASGCGGKSVTRDDGEDNGGGARKRGCVGLCEAAQMCSPGEPLDCASDCRDNEEQAAAAGCSAEFRAVVACVEEIPNICALEGDECIVEIEDYGVCLGAF